MEPPYNDDRMYVLEITRGVVSKPDAQGFTTTLTRDDGTSALGEGERRMWLLITRRNVRNYPPMRQDMFETKDEALAYYKQLVVTTPRLSLGGKGFQPTPTLEEYTAWLKSENLFDPVLNSK